MSLIKPNSLEKLYDAFSKVSKKAYEEVYMIPNQVLSKNLDWGDALNNYINGTQREMSGLKVFYLFVYSYFRNIYALLCLVFNKIAFDLSGASSLSLKPFSLDEDIILIDSYFLVKKINGNYGFNDIYFPSLTDILKKKKLPFIYTPKFFGSDNPVEFYKVMKILRGENLSILTEFHFFNWIDFAKLVQFVFLYPIRILYAAYKTDISSQEFFAVKNGIYESLKANGVLGYSRYLFGCHLSTRFSGKVKCISWYENQALDKCFYKGLKANSRKVIIYGAQLFIQPTGLLNLIPDEKEISFDVIPDVILTNGPYYIPKKTKLNYRVGPSLRYQHIFKKKPTLNPKGNILVLLPYFSTEVNRILQALSTIRLSNNRKFLIKFHPTTDFSKFQRYGCIFKFTEGELSDLFRESSMVLGSETGSLVEAVSQGLPAIHFEDPNRFAYNPLPEIGKGLVWDTAYTPDDVTKLIDRFTINLMQKEKDIVSFALEYRQKLFYEINEKTITIGFDL